MSYPPYGSSLMAYGNMKKDAIIVSEARKCYSGNVRILDGLNMTVARNSIYGLLGASGCGKTTLLSCIVGVKRLDSGDIWVLGGRPGSPGSGIPGPKVGYMPQDISLVDEFSVMDALYYFGRINGLEDYEIEERHGFLADLLQLPPKERLVKDMSGGQQRRVSFAAALIHRPELLILDEPTVGLDPVLRDNIWNYLVKITQEGMTVIITTHYIDEAKQANRIGFLRCGQLLVESTPTGLMNHLQCPTLEDAFLTLSQQQKDNQDRGIGNVQTVFTEPEEPPAPIAPSQLDTCQTNMHGQYWQRPYANKEPISQTSLMRKRMGALLTKNVLQFLRHPGGILFAFVFPIVQVTIFFNSIGGDPKDISIAVVNDEAGSCNNGKLRGNITFDDENFVCYLSNVSCDFLWAFNDSIVDKDYYDTIEEAHEAVKDGKAVGSMYFRSNFSLALQTRIEDMAGTEPENVEASEISVWMDMGNRQTGLWLQKKLYERFFDAYEEVVEKCGIPKKFADAPIRYEEPLYGKMDQKYTTFVAPTFILSLVYFLATSVSSSIIISDRHNGIWDRSLVQGVSTAQVLAAHLATQIAVIVIQVTVSLCLSFLQYDLECNGNLFVAIMLVFLTGVCGMCYGFLISVVCISHTMANHIATGSFYPIILLCGCIWPVEGMPKVLRWFSFSLPITIPGISLRAILDKGYPMDDPEVYSGFLVISGWTVSLLALCLIGLRTKQS